MCFLRCMLLQINITPRCFQSYNFPSSLTRSNLFHEHEDNLKAQITSVITGANVHIGWRCFKILRPVRRSYSTDGLATVPAYIIDRRTYQKQYLVILLTQTTQHPTTLHSNDTIKKTALRRFPRCITASSNGGRLWATAAWTLNQSQRFS